MIEAIAAGLSVVTFGAALALVYVPPLCERRRRRRFARETERFKQDPRVGDRVAYHHEGLVWRVGEVADVRPSNHEDFILLTVEVITPFGARVSRYLRRLSEVRYVGPDHMVGDTLLLPDSGELRSIDV